MQLISKKNSKPENCVLGFGIPTSKKGFLEDQHNPNKHFAKRFRGIWNKYYHEFIDVLDDIAPVLKSTGLTVVHDLTLSDYGQLFSTKKFDVVILFSHWHDDHVEFHDGLVHISEIVNQIPDTFAGIVDLCVCHPNDLITLIRKKKPDCLVRFIPKKTTPSIWLYFYLVLFRHLEEKDITYLIALEEVSLEFLKTKK